MRAGRIIAIIAGAVRAVIGFGALVGGGAMVVIQGTQRDSAGIYQTPTQRYQTSTAVLTMPLDLATPGGDRMPMHMLGTVQVRATATRTAASRYGLTHDGRSRRVGTFDSALQRRQSRSLESMDRLRRYR
jgi:hypothetical protein